MPVAVVLRLVNCPLLASLGEIEERPIGGQMAGPLVDILRVGLDPDIVTRLVPAALGRGLEETAPLERGVAAIGLVSPSLEELGREPLGWGVAVYSIPELSEEEPSTDTGSRSGSTVIGSTSSSSDGLGRGGGVAGELAGLIAEELEVELSTVIGSTSSLLETDLGGLALALSSGLTVSMDSGGELLTIIGAAASLLEEPEGVPASLGDSDRELSLEGLETDGEDDDITIGATSASLEGVEQGWEMSVPASSDGIPSASVPTLLTLGTVGGVWKLRLDRIGRI